ncbi:MAG: hypothetical protein PHG06_00425 [Parabacteroides sp.]|nr:hypothetical protein [Parabacteroides sp.]
MGGNNTDLEEIYQKYPWLHNYTVGTCYDPMIGAATGRRPEIDSKDYFEAVVALLVKKYNYDPYIAVDEIRKNVVSWAVYIGCEAWKVELVEETYNPPTTEVKT